MCTRHADADRAYRRFLDGLLAPQTPSARFSPCNPRKMPAHFSAAFLISCGNGLTAFRFNARHQYCNLTAIITHNAGEEHTAPSPHACCFEEAGKNEIFFLEVQGRRPCRGGRGRGATATNHIGMRDFTLRVATQKHPRVSRGHPGVNCNVSGAAYFTPKWARSIFSASAFQRLLCFLQTASSSAKNGSFFPTSAKSAMAVSGISMPV